MTHLFTYLDLHLYILYVSEPGLFLFTCCCFCLCLWETQWSLLSLNACCVCLVCTGHALKSGFSAYKSLFFKQPVHNQHMRFWSGFTKSKYTALENFTWCWMMRLCQIKVNSEQCAIHILKTYWSHYVWSKVWTCLTDKLYMPKHADRTVVNQCGCWRFMNVLLWQCNVTYCRATRVAHQLWVASAVRKWCTVCQWKASAITTTKESPCATKAEVVSLLCLLLKML